MARQGDPFDSLRHPERGTSRGIRASPRHVRPRCRDTEAAVIWLTCWTNQRFISDGALPVRPWKRVPDRQLSEIADALLKERARFDEQGRRG